MVVVSCGLGIDNKDNSYDVSPPAHSQVEAYHGDEEEVGLVDPDQMLSDMQAELVLIVRVRGYGE